MATAVANIDTHHEDMIHDSQFDYYSKKLATCSSDRTIKIFDVAENIYHCSATLTVHDGPVWQVQWAHPKFGVILASCSYDGKVVIQRESSPNNWIKVHEYKFEDASANSVAFAPHEFGLILASAASTGAVVVIEYKDGQWLDKTFENDKFGCNSVSWAPFNPLMSQDSSGSLVYRLATGSCDNHVRVWKYVVGMDMWQPEDVQAGGHSDWVRDVAWCPNATLPTTLFASCSEDKTVKIWKQNASGKWEHSLLTQFDAPVWRLSWSVTGTVLAVSTGDHKISLWKQSVDDSWVEITNLTESE